MSGHPLRIFSGSSHPQLASEVAMQLGVTVGKSTTQRLPDSEIHVMIDEVVIPYFPYARQDRMARGREAISARVVATLIETMGAGRVIFVN
jgi:ribose-phosphate pyrophosphokinase